MSIYIPEYVSIRKRKYDVGYEVCNFSDDEVIAEYVRKKSYDIIVKELKQLQDDLQDGLIAAYVSAEKYDAVVKENQQLKDGLKNEKRNANRNDFTGTQRLY